MSAIWKTPETVRRSSSALRQRRFGAYSLVEILVATAIICLLVGLSMPVVAEAKRQGSRGTSLSNLRQCGIALLIYAEDYGGMAAMPTRPAADEALRGMPTCDPGDYFRENCRANSSPPMIGSYAYVRDDTVYGSEEGWRFYLTANEAAGYSPALLINLFVSSKRHVPEPWFGPLPLRNPLPDRIQMFEADGAARLLHPRNRPDIGYTWQTLFLKR